MALMLDTTLLPVDERLEALYTTMSTTEVPMSCAAEPGSEPRHAVDVWELGPGAHVLRLAGSGLAVSRSAKQVRQAAPERVGLILQVKGQTRYTHCATQQVADPGDLLLTDQTETYDNRWSGAAVSKSIMVDYGRLNLPVDVVRRAVPCLRRSPVYDLARSHLALLCETPGPLSAAAALSLDLATTSLLRALIVSAADAGADHQDDCQRDSLHDILFIKIADYVERRLDQSDLTPDSIARAHNISRRQLYKIWESEQTTISRWIVARRLERARAELTDPGRRRMTVAAVARRCGFESAPYFSRAFKEAFGVTLREWRLTATWQAEDSQRF